MSGGGMRYNGISHWSPSMPKNKVIYLGMLLIAAVALLYAGAELSLWIRQTGILPWVLGLGILLMIAGIIWEVKKTKEAPVEATASSKESEL
jgi:hypothetical protein